MARWEPDARGRLLQAALELYAERGFEATTVANIAQRAGLTERTFFRHFTDKREVLFAGAHELEELLAGAVARAPAGSPPLDAVAKALEATGPMFEENRAFVRERQAVIAANRDLRERELIKLASLAATLAAALRERGVGEPAASLAAETGIAVFKVAFERWTADGDGPSLAEAVRDTFAELHRVTAG